jgi:cystathionine beta-lyase
VNSKALNIFETSWDLSSLEINQIREKVFIEEQKVPRSIEMDGHDRDCHQFLATYKKLNIGTARLRKYGKIERVSVIKEFRSLGIGSKIMEIIINKARTLDTNEIYLHSQEDSIRFYENIGFKTVGNYFFEAEIKHIKMIYKQT